MAPYTSSKVERHKTQILDVWWLQDWEMLCFDSPDRVQQLLAARCSLIETLVEYPGFGHKFGHLSLLNRTRSPSAGGKAPHAAGEGGKARQDSSSLSTSPRHLTKINITSTISHGAFPWWTGSPWQSALGAEQPVTHTHDNTHDTHHQHQHGPKFG